jgi:hypothetical protein
MLLPLGTRLLDVYAAVTAHLQKKAGTCADDDDDDVVAPPPVDLAPFNWSTHPRRPVDIDGYRTGAPRAAARLSAERAAHEHVLVALCRACCWMQRR